MAREATIFIIADGRGNYRVCASTVPPAARISTLQPGNANKLVQVYAEVAPAEMQTTILRRVRAALGDRHLDNDWYRAERNAVIDAVNEAVREAEAMVARPGHPRPEPPPQEPTGPDADPPTTDFDEALDDARGKVNLRGKANRNARAPWEP